MSTNGVPRVQSVERAFALLEVLAAAGGRLPLSELAERSGLPLGTAHRLLATLGAHRYVHQDGDRQYALGAALLPLGHAATRMLAGWAVPCLAELAEVTGESANLAVLEDGHVVYVAQVPGRHRMRMFTEVGRRVLPHGTAVGKVLLAWRDPDAVLDLLGRLGLPAHTANTLTTPEAFTAALAVVRRQGWGVDDEEEELGVRCVAVPVGPGGRAVAAISVSGPASRLAVTPELLGAMGRAADRLWRSVEGLDPATSV